MQNKHRKALKDFFLHKWSFYSVSIILFLILVFLAPKAPVNIDEFLHNAQAKEVVRWFLSLGKDKECLVDSPDNLRYYGQAMDNLAAFINHAFKIEKEYLLRNYIGAIIGGLLLLFTGWLTYRFTQNYFIAIISMLLLFISPRPFGQVFGNLKDIPFALGYTWATLGLLKFVQQLPKPSVSSSFLLATGIAFSTSIRIGGLIFYPIVALFTCLWFLFNYKKISCELFSFSYLWFILKHLIILLFAGYFLALLLWPYALQNPIKNPIKALSLMQHYSISIRQIFEGEYTWSTNLPWYYILKWLIISWPEVVLVSLLTYVGYAVFHIYTVGIKLSKTPPLSLENCNNKTLEVKNKTVFSIFLQQLTNLNASLPHLIIVFCALFPLVYVIIIDSNLYSGWRQLYFVYPLFIVLASIGIYKIWSLLKNNSIKIAFTVFLLFLTFIPIRHSFQTFPTHYVYFNSLVGGNKNAWSEYEYDYYFHGMKEATDWLTENIDLPKGSVIVSNSNLTPYFSSDMEITTKYTHFYYYTRKKWDYAILCNNYAQPYQLKHNTWLPEEPIKTFYHRGNPYIIIVKWNNEELASGLEYFREGAYIEAIPHLKKALDKKPFNVDLMVHLGECYLKTNNYTHLYELLETAYAINPNYEAFIYLEAKANYGKNNYSGALTLVTRLLKINPKYKKAYPLLVSCYKATGEHEKAKIIELQIKNKL